MEMTEKTISDLIHKWAEIKKKDKEFKDFFMKYMSMTGKVMIYTEELDYVIKYSDQKLTYNITGEKLKRKYPDIYDELKEMNMRSSSVTLKKCKKSQP